MKFNLFLFYGIDKNFSFLSIWNAWIRPYFKLIVSVGMNSYFQSYDYITYFIPVQAKEIDQ